MEESTRLLDDDLQPSTKTKSAHQDRANKTKSEPEEEMSRRTSSLCQFLVLPTTETEIRIKLSVKTKTNLAHKTKFTTTQSKLLNLIIISAIMSQLNQLSYICKFISLQQQQQQQEQLLSFGFPRITFAGAIECKYDRDCGNTEKVCHENKCICMRDRPIEDHDRCLTHAVINEQCSLNEQCLGNSNCVDGICSCGDGAISLYNPSSKIFYCHPKRRLNQECSYDSQCPSNSYCSNNKLGCLCQNGYAQATVDQFGVESLQCVPIFCHNTSSCESLEFYRCDDNKCKCLATHFNPNTAQCYRFGSTDGKATNGELQDNSLGSSSGGVGGNSTNVAGNDIYSIFKDLTQNSDRMWLVLIILISLSILVFVLIFMLIRKYYLGYCWTAHKKEYEPNNKNQAKNGYFNKNSMINKSFRRKNGEVEDDGSEDSAADRSKLVAPSSLSSPATKTASGSFANRLIPTTDKNLSYVKVNMNDNRHNNEINGHNIDDNRQQPHHHVSPLATSTSTPV